MGRALSAENEPAKGNEVIICWICLQMSLNLITLCRIMMEEKEREGEKKAVNQFNASFVTDFVSSENGVSGV